MLTILVGYLTNLRLSLKQLTAGVVAALIGFLVIRLRMQGSALHLAQAQLLQARYEATNKEDADAIKAAKSDMNAAMKEYNDAKQK